MNVALHKSYLKGLFRSILAPSLRCISPYCQHFSTKNGVRDVDIVVSGGGMVGSAMIAALGGYSSLVLNKYRFVASLQKCNEKHFKFMQS